MEYSKNITAAILTGGKSSRFGSPKELVKFNENRLIDISIKTAKKLTSEIIILSKKEFLFLSETLPIYSDLIPGCGPLGGIYTALHFSQNNWIATIPCDMPLLDPEIFHYLFSKRQNKLPLLAKSEYGFEPLVSIWNKDCLEKIKRKIQNVEFSVQNCLKEMNAVEVDVTRRPNYKKEWFFNINCKKDLRRLNKIVMT